MFIHNWVVYKVTINKHTTDYEVSIVQILKNSHFVLFSGIYPSINSVHVSNIQNKFICTQAKYSINPVIFNYIYLFYGYSF